MAGDDTIAAVRLFVASAAKLLTDSRPYGEGLIAWNVLTSLAHRGHEVVACVREADVRADAAFHIVEMGRTVPSNGLDPVAHAVRAAREFRRRGGAEAFDLVFWLRPIDSPRLFYPAVLMSRLPPGTPVVVGPVALPWPADAAGLRRGPSDKLLDAAAAVHRRLASRTLREAVVLAATPDVIPCLATVWARAAAVLPMAVDVDQFRFSPLPAVPRAVVIGTLTRRKGGNAVLEGFARAVRAVPDAELMFVGDGPERGALEERARELGLESSVRFTGVVGPADASRALREASVLVSGSHGEPFGMVVLEAMSTGRAVIAVAEGGPRTLVEDGVGGFLVPRDDADAFGRGLVRLLSDTGLAERMGRHNRERVEAAYSLPRFLERFEAVMLDAVAAARR